MSGITYCVLDDSREDRHREVGGGATSLERQQRTLINMFNNWNEMVARHEEERSRLSEISNSYLRRARAAELSLEGMADRESLATWTESIIPKFNARCLAAGRSDLLLPNLGPASLQAPAASAAPLSAANSKRYWKIRRRLERKGCAEAAQIAASIVAERP
jgi:hypothetical protein